MKKAHPTFDKVDSVVYRAIRYVSYAAAAFLLAFSCLWAVVRI